VQGPALWPTLIHTYIIWCEKVIKHKFPHCAPANLETSCLVEIGDVSRKLRLRCDCQFSWCALALGVMQLRTTCVRWGRVNCCWSSPARSCLAPSPAKLTILYYFHDSGTRFNLQHIATAIYTPEVRVCQREVTRKCTIGIVIMHLKLG
jgi:hypothetical protein